MALVPESPSQEVSSGGAAGSSGDEWAAGQLRQAGGAGSSGDARPSSAERSVWLLFYTNNKWIYKKLLVSGGVLPVSMALK